MIAQEERFSRSLPVMFSADELRTKADELASKVSRLNRLDAEKKQVGADYKARIDGVQSEVNLLARHISERCEYQQVECQAFLDQPVYGQKTIYRCDTGAEVGVETMNPHDRNTANQMTLEFEKRAEEAKVAAEPEAPAEQDTWHDRRKAVGITVSQMAKFLKMKAADYADYENCQEVAPYAVRVEFDKTIAEAPPAEQAASAGES